MCLAIPGKLVSLEGSDFERSGTVDFDGTRRTVNLAFTPEANEGDYVLVHVGFAISKIDESSAKEMYQTINDIAE